MSVTTRVINPGLSYCQNIYLSGYYRTQSVFNAPDADLDNPIHRIFRTQNIEHGPFLDRNVLMGSLRLCTKLIEASLPFWHTVFFGEVVEIRKTSESDGRQIRFVNEERRLTVIQEKDIQKALRGMANDIVFMLTLDEKTNGFCDLDLSTGKPRCIIYLGVNYYDRLREAYLHGTDVANWSWLQVKIAINL